MSPRIKRFVFVFLAFATLSVIATVTIVALIHAPFRVGESSIIEPPSGVVKLFFPSEWNLRQTKNACGVYAVYAAVSSWSSKQTEPSDVARNIFWRLPSGYTLPWGVEDGLSHYGQHSAYTADHVTDKEKLIFLEGGLSLRTPIVLLGREHDLLHYVTLLGYEKTSSTFFVYDSLLPRNEGKANHTVDLNGEDPGNITWTSNQLLDFWNAGGVFGFYRNYAVIFQTYTQD